MVLSADILKKIVKYLVKCRFSIISNILKGVSKYINFIVEKINFKCYPCIINGKTWCSKCQSEDIAFLRNYNCELQQAYYELNNNLISPAGDYERVFIHPYKKEWVKKFVEKIIQEESKLKIYGYCCNNSGITVGYARVNLIYV